MAKVEVKAEASNWDAYFNLIKPVCPWSYTAWQNGEIKITKWQGVWQPLDQYQAIVYTVNLNRRRLKKLCARLDESKEYEWLWSEPRYGKWASPEPILIQQDRKYLNDIRKRLKNKGLF